MWKPPFNYQPVEPMKSYNRNLPRFESASGGGSSRRSVAVMHGGGGGNNRESMSIRSDASSRGIAIQGGPSGHGLWNADNEFRSCAQCTYPSHVLVDLGRVDLDLGSSPGWWAATVAAYCPSRPVELPKSKSTKPSLRGHGTPCSCRGIFSCQSQLFRRPSVRAERRRRGRL